MGGKQRVYTHGGFDLGLPRYGKGRGAYHLFLVLCVALVAFLALGAPALAEDPPDGTEPSPIWLYMEEHGLGYNFGTTEDFFVPEWCEEGEAGDPYVYTDDHEDYPAGTYLMPDGSLFVLPDGVPLGWF